MNDAADVLATLKDFQRATVEYTFDRLWTADDQVKHFLVADEVGLGKTMVAKGVIAKAVEHLRETRDRINVVYICSNGQIARQNLGRLNVVGGEVERHADRLTLLPRAMRRMADNTINFVSFTPGTSFHVTRGGGRYQERTLLYRMLDVAWDGELSRDDVWLRFFQGGMRYPGFRDAVGWIAEEDLDPDLCRHLGEQVYESADEDGRTLRSALDECLDDFRKRELADDPVYGSLGIRRDALIGRLRHLIATAAVAHLEPDIVILDEFQRFKDLIGSEGDSPGQQLARQVFAGERTKVLLLSATPYKMYTLPDEPDGDDHYRDFISTVSFLAGPDRATEVERQLAAIRVGITSGQDREGTKAAKDFVERELRRVMARTERLSSTADRDGMVVERQLSGATLATGDVQAWQTLDEVANHLRTNDPFEYWRSAPYALNLMDRNGYQVRKRFHDAIEASDDTLGDLLRGSPGLLSWADVKAYEKVDPNNAKLRGLQTDLVESAAWKAVWLPPSLPYYQLSGVYADPKLQAFTKRLIFSAWNVVPKAIAVLLSYEAERRIAPLRTARSLDYETRTAQPLQWKLTSDQEQRPASLPLLSLLYPHQVLADLGDPLRIAREYAQRNPGSLLTADELRAVVRERVQARVTSALPPGDAANPTRTAEWYLAAPLLLDQAVGVDVAALATELRRVATGHEGDDTSNAGQHFHAVVDLVSNHSSLGPRPDDLVEVLTDLAIAGPGVCALRALGRVSSDRVSAPTPPAAVDAFRVALGLRSTFNKPEVYALSRGADAESDPGYWRRVLHHCVDGCLQSVLDEYAHVLVESEGLQDAGRETRTARISHVMAEALSTRSATNPVDFVTVSGSTPSATTHNMSSHIAARYGHVQTTDESTQRESTVRVAFNSPFRPFILASTSAGQEGLDFHTYSHAVVHWNLPSNPVDLEQREGRVHRYKGHAVRKNVALSHGSSAFTYDTPDPWCAVFAQASAARTAEANDLVPFWVFAPEGGARIERYVPAQPLSREQQQYERLQRTVGAYRMVLGQPRQADLIRFVGDDADWLRIDLSPGRRADSTHANGSGQGPRENRFPRPC